MFYTENLKKFHIFQINTVYQNFLHGDRDYVFLEDTNDISGIDLFPYESFIEPNISGQTVKLITSGSIGTEYEFLYVKIILDLLNISAQIGKNFTGYALLGTLTGAYDIFVMPVVGFSQINILLPTNMDSSLIWVKNMRYKSSQYFFLNTFTLQLWIFYLSALLICILLCWCFHKCLQRYLTKLYHAPIELFNLISLLFDQGGDNAGRSTPSSKFILVTYLFLLIMFYASFGAFLSVLLAIKRINLPFDNLDGLLQQPDYIVCYWSRANLNRSIQSYPRGKYSISVGINHQKYCPKEGTNSYYNTNFTCEYEKLAFLESSSFQNNLKTQCDLTTPLKGRYFHRYRSIFVNSGFRYKNQFNVLILKMMSSGVNDYLSRHHVYKPDVVYSTDETMVPIDMNHISLILYLFVFGMICASLILIIEIWHAKTKANNVIFFS